MPGMRSWLESDLFDAFVEAEDWDEKIAQLTALRRKQLPPLPVPDENQFRRWLRPSFGDCEPLRCAINKAARRKNRWNDPLHHLSWISAVALARWNETRLDQQREMAA